MKKPIFYFKAFLFILTFLFFYRYALSQGIHFRTYEGPALKKNQVGILFCGLPLMIEEIDGKKNAEIVAFNNYSPKKIEWWKKRGGWSLLPGEHEIKVAGATDRHGHPTTWKGRPFIQGKWTFKFKVEAGHKYYVSYEQGKLVKEDKFFGIDQKHFTVTVFVYDKTAKKKVAL